MYLGDSEGHAEILPPLQPEAPGGGAREGHRVAAAHVGWSRCRRA